MFSKPEPFGRQRRTGTLLAAAAVLAALLSACASTAMPPVGSGALPTPAMGATVQNQLSASAALPAAPDELTRVLAYADRVRQMPPAELGQEVSRLASPASAFEQLELALALSQLHQLPELIRAQELLTRVLANAEVQALHPLARLLAARYGEQRRLEEQLDRQTQQTRDVQRRLDQTNDRLEALKAIERSLSSRPAAASPAPAGQTRPAKP